MYFLNKRMIFDKLDLKSNISSAEGDGTWVSNSANLNLYNILKKIKNFNNYHFVDLGCGKGGTLYLVAFFFNVKQITGIERDTKIVDVCKQNLCNFKHVEIICDDVKEVSIFPTMNFFYMSNPFGSETMSCILEKIIISDRRYPREIYILYRNPVENDIILNKGFNLINSFVLKALQGKKHWNYESSPNERVNLYKLEKIT